MQPDLRRHIVAERLGRCCHCGQETPYVDVCFEAFLCPGACSDAKEDEFWAALRELPDSAWENPFE